MEREQRGVEGWFEFFSFFRDDKRGTNRSINWTDAAECNCRPFRFETCGLPHEGEPSFLTITDRCDVDSKGSALRSWPNNRLLVFGVSISIG